MRTPFMWNEFIIVGPHEDPARSREAKDAADAFRKIFARNAAFASRGDESGTHLKELKVWARAELKPSGKWYIESGTGMGETLILADEKRAYCLTDEATFAAFAE